MSTHCHIHGTCPFSGTGESEYAQNQGCLPSPYEIIVMRLQHGRTWACHSDPTKPCQGALNYLKRNGEDAIVLNPDLLTEEDRWESFTKPSEKTRQRIKSHQHY